MRRLVMALCLLPSACASGAAVQAGPAQNTRATLDAMIEVKELPGAQYVALTKDRTLFALHAGTADARSAQALRADTLQMAYSLTKALTAIAALQLVDRGKLGLDRPLSDVYAEHPYGRAITLRMLLAHTAGVPSPMPLDWFSVEGEPLDREAKLRRALAANAKLAAEPGARYGYTNLGYWLLEKVIEAASGQDYAAYLGEHVLAPVGVTPEAASFELPARERFAAGHSRRMTPMNLLLWLLTPGRYWAEPARGWSRAARLIPHGRAYGGLYCNADALARVLQDLLQETPRLLSPRMRDAMFEAQRTNDGASSESPLGWVMGQLEGVQYIGKQGGGLGFHGNLRVYPTLGLATVLLANRTEITPGPIDARSDVIDASLVRARKSGDLL
jgi:CubicO group peptidase (beta-lactamase class C family)